MKNLDKRIISAVTAFGLAVCSMITGEFNFSEDKVQAETEAVIPEVTTSMSENVSLPKNRKGTYSINARDEFTATNGILTVSYIQDKLSFRDIRLCDALKNTFTYTKTDIPGKIVIGFASNQPITFKDNMISIDFDLEPGQINSLTDYCDYRVEELETEDADGVVQNISRNRLISSSVLSPRIGLSIPAADNFKSGIGLFVYDNCGFTNAVFNFEYNPEDIEFREVKLCELFSKCIVDTYVVKPGLVRCVVVSDKTISENGDFVRLQFNTLKEGMTEIKISFEELNNVVSDSDIAEYMVIGTMKSNVWANLPKVTSPLPTVRPTDTVSPEVTKVSKIPAVPYTQPYATPKPPSPSYTEPAVTSVSVNETEITTEVESVTSEAAVTTAEVNPEPAEQPAETAPASSEQTVQPTETAPASPEPTEQPTETTPASPVPTVQPTETAPASPVPTVTPTLTPPSLTPPTSKPAEPAEAESFDVNDDGAVNTKDLLSLIKMIIDDHAAKKVTADLNGDGHINAEDIIIMKKHLAQ